MKRKIIQIAFLMVAAMSYSQVSFGRTCQDLYDDVSAIGRADLIRQVVRECNEYGWNNPLPRCGGLLADSSAMVANLTYQCTLNSREAQRRCGYLGQALSIWARTLAVCSRR